MGAELHVPYADRLRGCFGCGPDNPQGLHLTFTTVGEGAVQATFTPLPHHQGFQGTLHGGIIASLLDETTAWAVMLTLGRMAATASLAVTYCRPTPMDGPLTILGRIVARKGRRVEVYGELRDAAGEVCAKADAVHAILDPEIHRAFFAGGDGAQNFS